MGLFKHIYSHLMDPLGADGKPTRVELSEREAFDILLRIASRLARGFWWRLRVKRADGLFFVGRGARILDPQHLSVGRRVKIEELAEVQCLSRYGVILGDRVTIGRGASIRPSSYYGHERGDGLEVGAGSSIGAFSWIGASGHVSIGRDVMLGPRVMILPENHNFSDTSATIKSQGVERRSVVIEDDCWLGANAVVLAGVTIGHGSVVAAGSVVNRDVPPGTVVGGIPARVLKRRWHGSANEVVT